MRKHILLFGVAGGLLIALLRWMQYRYLVVEHSVELYAALIAALFAAVGLWLGTRLTRKARLGSDLAVDPRRGHQAHVAVATVPAAVPPRASFARDDAVLRTLGITPREFEILALMAEGLSNREIAERAFVSENTVKTHTSRLFEKLSARRRTQAVQIARDSGLLP